MTDYGSICQMCKKLCPETNGFCSRECFEEFAALEGFEIIEEPNFMAKMFDSKLYNKK